MTADKDESLSPLYNTEEHSDEDEEEKLLIFHPEKEYQGSNKLYRKVYNYFNDFSEYFLMIKDWCITINKIV